MKDDYRAPVLEDIVRQHAEQAAFLWTQYDQSLQHPDDDPEVQAETIADLTERLEASLDGLRIAGADGLRIAEERYAEYPEAGELFVVRMLQPGALGMRVADIDPDKVRAYIVATLGKD